MHDDASVMTYDSLVENIQSYLERTDTATLDKIPLFIMLAEQVIASQIKFLGNMTVNTSTMTAGQNIIDKPARWHKTVSMNITVDGVRQPIFIRRYEYLNVSGSDAGSHSLTMTLPFAQGCVIAAVVSGYAGVHTTGVGSGAFGNNPSTSVTIASVPQLGIVALSTPQLDSSADGSWTNGWSGSLYTSYNFGGFHNKLNVAYKFLNAVGLNATNKVMSTSQNWATRIDAYS